MLTRCVSVFEFRERVYRDARLYAPCLFMAVPNLHGNYTWVAERFLGEICDRPSQARALAWAHACAMGLQMLDELEEDQQATPEELSACGLAIEGTDTECPMPPWNERLPKEKEVP